MDDLEARVQRLEKLAYLGIVVVGTTAAYWYAHKFVANHDEDKEQTLTD